MAACPKQFVRVDLFHPRFVSGLPVGVAAWSAIECPDRMLVAGMGCARRSCDNGPQVAEGGYAQTLKRSTDMKDKTNIQNEEQTGRLQQPAVGGSLPISVLLAEMNELPKLKDFASLQWGCTGIC